MDLNFTAEEHRFREEVEAFMQATVRDDYRDAVLAGQRPTPAQMTEWQQAMHARGWGAPTWPVEFGGTGWTPTQLYIFEMAAAAANALLQFHQGLELIGPIIFSYGSPAQKAYYLPRIVSGEDWWCQGYSEPGAGSDLAGLSTRAALDGDHYVLDGQKMWTSYAHVATQMFCLARTSTEARRQSGISLFLVDMRTPGLTVRPVITLDEKHHTNEVFLDNVRVPVDCLVGEEGQGWSYGKVLLDRERGVGAASALRVPAQARELRRIAAGIIVAGAPLTDDPAFGSRLAQLEIEAIAVETMVMRLMAEAAAGLDSGPRASMLKLRWSELVQQVTELWVEAIGHDAALFEPLPGETAVPPGGMPQTMQGAVYSRVMSIYGGSSEIQRNIIARRSLGL